MLMDALHVFFIVVCYNIQADDPLGVNKTMMLLLQTKRNSIAEFQKS